MTLTLLSKPGCHLCEDLRTLLDELQSEYGYALEEIDITSRDDLFIRYRNVIPVLLQGQVELASGRIDEPRLVAILNAIAAGD